MATVKCVHCNAMNDPVQTAGYCDECGKRLPGAFVYSSGPSRSVKINEASSEARRRAINWVSAILFAVAFFQLVCGGGVFLWLPLLEGNRDVATRTLAEVLPLNGGVFIAMIALGLWARFQPLPPPAIGLVVYVLLTILDLILSGGNLLNLLFKSLIIVALINAIMIAAKMRKDPSEISDGDSKKTELSIEEKPCQ